MSLDIKNKLQQLLEESSNFNQNDLLVNAPSDHSKLIVVSGELDFPKDEFPSGIIREAKKSKSESGINSMCLATGIASISFKNNDFEIPLIITPCEFTIVNRTNKIIIEPLFDDSFVNPYLIKIIQQEFEVSIPENLTLQTDTNVWCEFLSTLGENNVNSKIQLIGNFHHHRYQVIKELEELLSLDVYSSSLRTILGDSVLSSYSLPSPSIYSGNLFPADGDHEAVFRLMKDNDIVVQGPPGTGKSQVLSNILGKSMIEGNSVLVLSEKRSALEVLQKRLAEHDLDKLCFISTSESLSKNLLLELKESWDYMSDKQTSQEKNLLLSEQYEANLQMILDLLNQPSLIGGISYHDFLQCSKLIDYTNAVYVSEIPSLKHYLSVQEIVAEIYSADLSSALQHVRLSSIKDDSFISIDQQIENWISQLGKIQPLLRFTTWGEFSSCMRQAAICQVFENDLFKKYHAIFEPNSKGQKKFIKLRKQKNALETELEELAKNDAKWNCRITDVELKNLLEQIEKGGILNKIRAKKSWLKYTDSPYNFAKETIVRKLRIVELEHSLSHLLIKFCDLNVDNSQEVEQINHLLPVYNQEKWNVLSGIPEETRSTITGLHNDLNSLWSDIHHKLIFNDSDQLLDILTRLRNQLNSILTMRSKLVLLDDKVYGMLKEGKTLEAFEQCLFHSHWIKLQEQFPSLVKFNVSDLREKIEKITGLQTNESQQMANEIQSRIVQKFTDANLILNTPAQKLKGEQKDLKKRLKKGKSILVKEFAKSRNHPSIRELYNSEAREWIQILKPIWLSNPVQLAKSFPLNTNLFDLCVFDEASQIPLQNALGGIQRAKRVIVAGDEHQMGPTSYFQTGNSEMVDLLHQAIYYWNKTGLMHHYRSSHPDLIQFSNIHFYDNQLKAFPSTTQSSCPIKFHLVENGKFVDRKNTEEAKIVAEFISAKLRDQKEIGIVAFSEEQLAAIWSALDSKTQDNLQLMLDSNRGFFKSIENVQGDECDELIISFGYGKNEDGDFHMRFGPMNTSNGRRRLNVLLTRAKNELHFFSSVTSSDFKMSDNESVELIHKWFRFIENYKPSQSVKFPFGVETIAEGEKVHLLSAYHSLPDAREMINYHRVLKSRGWEINYA